MKCGGSRCVLRASLPRVGFSSTPSPPHHNPPSVFLQKLRAEVVFTERDWDFGGFEVQWPPFNSLSLDLSRVSLPLSPLSLDLSRVFAPLFSSLAAPRTALLFRGVVTRRNPRRRHSDGKGVGFEAVDGREPTDPSCALRGLCLAPTFRRGPHG